MEQEALSACEQLERSCGLESEADFEVYGTAVQRLRKVMSPDALPRMLRCLRDTDSGEVQYELVEACEAYATPIYIRALLPALPELRTVAPQWAGLLLQSALNTPDCVQEIVRSAPGMPASDLATLRRWVTELATSTPKYADILTRLPS